MNPPYRIVKTIDLLDEKIEEMPDRAIFNEAAGAEDIMDLEVDLGITLPLSYKIFLNNYDGGFLCGKYQAQMIKEDGNFEGAEWNSIHLFGMEEIRSVYEDKSLMNWKLFDEKYDVYPFIPFCRTSTGELLIFVNLLDKSGECPVFDAFHEEFPNSWGMLFNNFTDLFEAYVNSNGYIPTTSYMKPTAAEFIEQGLYEKNALKDKK